MKEFTRTYLYRVIKYKDYIPIQSINIYTVFRRHMDDYLITSPFDSQLCHLVNRWLKFRRESLHVHHFILTCIIIIYNDKLVKLRMSLVFPVPNNILYFQTSRFITNDFRVCIYITTAQILTLLMKFFYTC